MEATKKPGEGILWGKRELIGLRAFHFDTPLYTKIYGAAT